MHDAGAIATEAQHKAAAEHEDGQFSAEELADNLNGLGIRVEIGSGVLPLLGQRAHAHLLEASLNSLPRSLAGTCASRFAHPRGDFLVTLALAALSPTFSFPCVARKHPPPIKKNA